MPIEIERHDLYLTQGVSRLATLTSARTPAPLVAHQAAQLAATHHSPDVRADLRMHGTHMFSLTGALIQERPIPHYLVLSATRCSGINYICLGLNAHRAAGHCNLHQFSVTDDLDDYRYAFIASTTKVD